VAVQAERKPFTSSIVEPKARSFFASSVGTKVIIGTTGILLVLYLILHIAGNLLVFLGPSTFNSYSHMLISNPLVVPVEIGLAAVFFIHLYKAITNWAANRRARPVGYYRRKWGGKPSRKTIASSTMIFSGLVLFVFIAVHLYQMKFGPEYLVPSTTGSAPEASAVRDLYRLEMEVFGNVLNVAFYALCMIVVGAHIWHGFSSAFQSLGADHPKYTPWLLAFGKVLAVGLAGGFLAIPVWAYFFGVHA
jgi:succinate dehydrogenase / fumarate reductase, cytochrome b subunit